MSYKTVNLDELRVSDVGKEVKLVGWAGSVRDHGGIIFVDLRDRTGVTQLVFDPEYNSKSYELAQSLRNEYVINVVGVVKERDKQNINSNLSTGDIEVFISELEILNSSDTLPFEVANDGYVSEALKLKYRYLYLRRKDVYEKMLKKSKMLMSMRKFLDANGFVDVDTPVLNSVTPEGARNFIVPSRLHENKFFSLAQSPQLFKQLLMIGGVERYYQIAKCFRDEDARADRLFEFLQLDIEFSFMKQEEILNIMEPLIKQVFEEVVGYKIEEQFPRMTYAEAMDLYGSDKPDTRFGLQIKELTDVVKDSQFKVFSDVAKNGGLVRGINVEAASISRKEIDELTVDIATFGAKGLAWIKIDEDNSCTSTITKFLSETEKKSIIERMNGKPGDILFFVADAPDVVHSSLGYLRLKLGKMLNLIDKSKYNFLWVVDFPLFEWNKESKSWGAKHHQFTNVHKDDIGKLETDPGSVRSEAYDLVLNGVEIGGGSLRIYKEEIQKKVFSIIGLDDESAQAKFGFLLDALKFGAPPHGGIAFGIERLLATFICEESIREIVAFPKTQTGQCLLTDAPSIVEPQILKELKIKIVEREKVN